MSHSTQNRSFWSVGDANESVKAGGCTELQQSMLKMTCGLGKSDQKRKGIPTIAQGPYSGPRADLRFAT